MSFFTETFEEVKKESEDYMKLQDGENRIRILSACIQGFEDWDNNRPIRYRINNKPLTSKDPEKKIREFWSMIVWNYALNRIQILNVTQEGIKKTIKSLVSDQDWGVPSNYDLKIIREGKEINTKYSVSPCPHKAVTSEIIQAFNLKRCNLDALFDNKDPFSTENSQFTPGIFQTDFKAEVKAQPKNIHIEEHDMMELDGLLELCQPGYKESLMQRLKEKFNFTSLDQLTQPIFEFCKREAIEKKKEYAEFKRKEQELDIGF